MKSARERADHYRSQTFTVDEKTHPVTRAYLAGFDLAIEMLRSGDASRSDVGLNSKDDFTSDFWADWLGKKMREKG